MLTTYAMRSFKLCEKLSRRPSLSLLRVLKALSDTFLGVGMGGNIEKVLIGFGVLHNSGCFPLHCQNDGTLAFLELLHEITGTTSESRQGLDIFGDVKHWPTPISTFLGAPSIPHGRRRNRFHERLREAYVGAR